MRGHVSFLRSLRDLEGRYKGGTGRLNLGWFSCGSVDLRHGFRGIQDSPKFQGVAERSRRFLGRWRQLEERCRGVGGLFTGFAVRAINHGLFVRGHGFCWFLGFNRMEELEGRYKGGNGLLSLLLSLRSRLV